MTLELIVERAVDFGDGFTIIDKWRVREDVKWVVADGVQRGLLMSLGHNGYYGPSLVRTLPAFREMLGLNNPLTSDDLELIKQWFTVEIGRLPRR